MSLRIRLTVITSLLFLCGMLLGVAFLVGSARQRVANEVAASATLTVQLLDALLPAGATNVQDPGRDALLQQLSALEAARHMQISVGDASDTAASARQPDDAGPGAQASTAPGWFVRLVQGDDLSFTRPLDADGERVITIRTQQADEIAEVWQDTRVFLVLLGIVLLLLNGVLYLIIGRWFAPVQRILDDLAAVQQGGGTEPLPATALPELQVISARVSRLADVLRTSRAENEQLTRRSLGIQEEERRHLAQELHDEMGQSISAIKAIAFSIAQRNQDDALSREAAQRIGTISNNVRDHIRSMMQRLRPAMLDELGLLPALEHMVDEWNGDHGNLFCSLRTSGNASRLGGEQQIHVYRIVQEALTNVAAHADATRVEVQLDCGGQLRLRIQDDGKGFDAATVRRGMGLSGMQERVKALGGSWQLYTAPGTGVTIHVTLSLQ